MTINFAHRGYRTKYPENTLLAFRKAIEAGCGGIELDVQLSKDGEIVIIHDEDVKRTTNAKGAVCDKTLEELRALDAGRGEKIPLLSEYFDLVEDLPIITNIELKNSEVPYEGMEEKVLELVRARGMSDRIIFSSFSHESVRKIKKLAPDIPCGFLCTKKIDFEAVAAAMKETGVEYIHPGVRSLKIDFMEYVIEHDIPISVWTVNGKARMKRLIAHGAYGIFTDNPAKLAKLIKELESN